jgi:hypothetical protein
VSLVAASAISRTTPVTVLIQKPVHSNGYSRSSGFTGILGQKPKKTRLIIALHPATMDMPIVCTTRNVGKAHMELDSRTQTLNGSCSSVFRKSFMRACPFCRPLHSPRRSC